MSKYDDARDNGVKNGGPAGGLARELANGVVTNIVAALLLECFGVGSMGVMLPLLCAVLWVLWVLAGHFGYVLRHGGIDTEIVRRIDIVRKMYLASDYLRGSWPAKYSELIGDIRDQMSGFSLLGWMNLELQDVVSSGASWVEEDASVARGESLRNCLLSLRFVFGAKFLVGTISRWSARVQGGAKPGRGIDANIDPALKGELARRMATAFGEWASERPYRNGVVSVLFIGANDAPLSIAALEEMSNCGYDIDLYLKETADKAQGKICEHFGRLRGRVVVQGDAVCPKYDVVIVTHYYQHHDLERMNRMPIPAVDGGLLIWMSAISRAKDFDEYVCEGCMPKKASLGASGLKVMSLQEPGKTVRITYAAFEDIFRGHEPILASGFPKKFLVDTDRLYSDVAKCVEDYLRWEKGTRISSLLIDYASELGRKSLPPDFEIINVKMDPCTNGVFLTGECGRGYALTHVEYKVGSCRSSLPLIITTGFESNEWAEECDGGQMRLVSILPAFRHLCRRGLEVTSNAGEGPIADVLKSLVSNDLEGQGQCARYLQAVMSNRSRRVFGKSCAAFEIVTDVADVDLNNVILYFAVNANGVTECYGSYLPKRRYLSREEFDGIYQLKCKFKALQKDLRMQSSLFLPCETRSVTWLRCVKSIRRMLNDQGFVLDEGSVFFHKLLGCMPLATDGTTVVSGEEFRSLGCKGHALGKDVSFNKLPLKERERMLGCVNAHDILLAARKHG